jgi:prepilin-type N-terminal cleavage/methylation domain-containing protein
MALRTNQRARRSAGSPGFTLLEMLLAAAILAVAIALVISAFAGSARYVRDKATEMQLRSLDVAIQQFEKDYGFLPPLVDCGIADPRGGGARLRDYDRGIDESYANTLLDPVARLQPAPTRPEAPAGRLKVFGYAEFDNGEEEAINRYLRNETGISNDVLYPRYSFVSLGAYLLGSLPAEVDGGAGNLMGRPTQDGRFDESREKRQPTLDVSTMTENKRARLRRIDTAGIGAMDPARSTINIIVDRNLVSIRYYRWEPTYHGDTPVQARLGAPNNDQQRIGAVRDSNVPYLLGYSRNAAGLTTNTNGGLDQTQPNMDALRRTRQFGFLSTQRYALAAAGNDALFGDTGGSWIDTKQVSDNIVISAGALAGPEDSK